MHNHSKNKKCNHVLKICEECNVVYCELCLEEWDKRYQGVTSCSTAPNTINPPWIKNILGELVLNNKYYATATAGELIPVKLHSHS